MLDCTQQMEIFFRNYSIFVTYIDSLSQTDSQALKPAEIEVVPKKWLQE